MEGYISNLPLTMEGFGENFPVTMETWPFLGKDTADDRFYRAFMPKNKLLGEQ
ncbi:MAG: hypothetical protein K0Q74_1530 [Gammaproteobacteria bacterium]|jgi:hypothetical protein|nr:hypothetical protein [Gammaproteobacteria bacterium]